MNTRFWVQKQVGAGAQPFVLACYNTREAALERVRRNIIAEHPELSGSADSLIATMREIKTTWTDLSQRDGLITYRITPRPPEEEAFDY